jgi:SAM-dependent methyltransferase
MKGNRVTLEDAVYIENLIVGGQLKGPVLELGAGYGGATCRSQVSRAGMAYVATDMFPSQGVDVVADFADPVGTAAAFQGMEFKTVLVLNVLEHTFDPIRVLDTALQRLSVGGRLVVITPTVWTLHGYPIDCCRLLPDWYVTYAELRGCQLLHQHFEYLGYGRIRDFMDKEGRARLPRPVEATNPWRGRWSRTVHKIFNTFGRSMAFPSHVAIGAVLVRK